MPSSHNGIGTAYCGNGAAIHWTKPGLITSLRPDSDAIECVVVFFLPIFPRGTYHTFAWSGNICQALPIKRTGRLLARAMLRPWAFALMILGGCFAAIWGMVLAATAQSPDARVFGEADWAFLGGGLGAFVLGLWICRILAGRNRRDRDIRLVLGRHEFGSSDPAMWNEATLATIKPGSRLFGAASDAEAGGKALGAGRFALAMLAARLATGRGEPWGEELTDEILRDLRLGEVMSALRKQPWRRAELLPGDALPSLDRHVADPGQGPICFRDGKPVTAESGGLFYDGRNYCESCLTAAGGPDFPATVRGQTTLEARAPDPWLSSGFFVVMILLFATVLVVTLIEPAPHRKSDDPAGAIVGMGVIIAGFLAALVFGRLRTVKLAGGRLSVRQKSLPVSAIQSIRQRRWLGLFPAVEVQAGPISLRWPYRPGRTAAIEHAISAAIALRGPSVVSAGGDNQSST